MHTAAIAPQQTGAGHAADSGGESATDGFAILLQALAGGQRQATAKGTAMLLAPGDVALAGSPEEAAAAVNGTATEGATASQIDVTLLPATAQQGDATQGSPVPAAEQQSAVPAAGAPQAAQTIEPNAAAPGSATTATQPDGSQARPGKETTGDGSGSQPATSQAPGEQPGQRPRPATTPTPQAADSARASATAANAAVADPAGAPVGTTAQRHEADQAGGSPAQGAQAPAQDQAATATQIGRAASGDLSATAATALAPTLPNPVATGQSQFQSTQTHPAARNSGSAVTTPAGAQPDTPQTPAATPAQTLPGAEAEAAEPTSRPALAAPKTPKTPGQQGAKLTGPGAQTAQVPSLASSDTSGAQTNLPFADRLSAFRAMSALDPFGFVTTATGSDSAMQLASFVAEGATLTVQQAAAPSSIELPTAPGARAAVADPSAQLAIQIHRAITANSQQFRIQLEPAELGRVDVRLNFGRDGRVRATIGVERAETLDLIQRDAQELERILKEAGTDPNKLDLRFNLQGDGRDQAGGEDEADPKAARNDSDAAADPASTNLAEANAGSQRIDGLLDMHV